MKSEKQSTIRWLIALRGFRKTWKIVTLTVHRPSRYQQWAILIIIMRLQSSCLQTITTLFSLLIAVELQSSILTKQVAIYWFPLVKLENNLIKMRFQVSFPRTILVSLKLCKSRWFLLLSSNRRPSWWWKQSSRWNRWTWLKLKRWRLRYLGWKHVLSRSLKMA